METTLAPAGDPNDMAAIEAELTPLTSGRLRSVLVESCGSAVSHIARAAVCVKLLEARGEDLHGIPQLGLFRRIASGLVLPDVVWKYSEAPGRQVVERAPINDQRKLADNPMYPVVEPAPGGGFTPRMMDLSKASVAVVRQVVAPEGLRTPEEQIAYLTTNRPRPISPATESSEVKEPFVHQLTIQLTKSEYAALRVNAARAGKSEKEMARRGLLLSGVLKEGRST